MIEFVNILFLMIIGFVSLMLTLIFYLTGEKVDIKKEIEQKELEVKIFNSQIKLIPFVYLIIIIILFLIGIFNDFIINSVIGLIIALIPFVAYWIFDYKEHFLVRKK